MHCDLCRCYCLRPACVRTIGAEVGSTASLHKVTIYVDLVFTITDVAQADLQQARHAARHNSLTGQPACLVFAVLVVHLVFSSVRNACSGWYGYVGCAQTPAAAVMQARKSSPAVQDAVAVLGCVGCGKLSLVELNQLSDDCCCVYYLQALLMGGCEHQQQLIMQ